MKQNSQRPVFQGVLKYRYPVMAIASGLHRISGIILFLLMPILLLALQKSLLSPNDFMAVKAKLTNPFAVTVLWVILAALVYHLIAGIRHMIMDAGFGESLKGGKIAAYIVFALTIIGLFLIGFLV